jgi:hypothetical protein
MFPAIFQKMAGNMMIKDDFVASFHGHHWRFQEMPQANYNQVASSSGGGWTIETFNQPLC